MENVQTNGLFTGGGRCPWFVLAQLGVTCILLLLHWSQLEVDDLPWGGGGEGEVWQSPAQSCEAFQMSKIINNLSATASNTTTSMNIPYLQKFCTMKIYTWLQLAS